MIKKIIRKIDELILFGSSNIYIKIKDYLNLNHLKSFRYKHASYYNPKKLFYQNYAINMDLTKVMQK